MTAEHKRRLMKLEGAVPGVDERSWPWRTATRQSPLDPVPEDHPGENLMVRLIVSPRHQHDAERPDCNCLTCWERAAET